MSKRKEPSSPTEATGSKSASSAFEDEESALRSEIRTMKIQRAMLVEEKATFESKFRAEKDKFMRELRDKERHFQEKWRAEAERVEKALAKAEDRLDRLREAEEERRHHLSLDENASRLDKLPPELWDKVFDHLKDGDLFPLALSCRYFRQKQKELVARKSELRMRTAFKDWRYTPYLSLSRDYILFACACALNTPLSDIQGPSASLGKRRALIHAFFVKIAFSWGDYSLAKTLGFSRMDHDEYVELAVEWSEQAVSGYSLTSDDLELLKFLNENRHRESPSWSGWCADCIQLAAGCGDLELLKYAKENGIPLGELEDLEHRDPCSSAAYGGHLEVLQWLRENGCPWDSLTCAQAAEEGHFEILRWALENGCPWDACTCARAAEGGHFEILRWALENGCPWDMDHTYRVACQRYDQQDYVPFSKYHERMNIKWSKISDWIDTTGRTLYADQAVQDFY